MCHWGHGLKEFELLSPRREQSYKLPPCIDPLAFSFFPTGFFISSALFHLHLFFSPVLSPQISEPKTFQLWHLSKLLFLWPCCKGAQDAVPHGRVLHPGMWRSNLFWYGMCVSASSYGCHLCVLPLSPDDIRRGRPGLCQGAEEQIQDQALLRQTPTDGLPARPDHPGRRQHGNVRLSNTHRDTLLIS